MYKVSLVLSALLLLSGCGENKEHKSTAATQETPAQVEKTAPQEHKTQEVSKSASAKASAKPLEDIKMTTAPTPTPAKRVTQAKEEATQKVTQAKEEVTQKATQAKEEVAQKVTQVKEETAKAVEATAQKIDAAKLYVACAGCHGGKGEKKALGKSELIGGWSKDKTVTALEGYKAGTRNVHGMGAVMKGQASKLSKEQIEALGEYISKMQ